MRFLVMMSLCLITRGLEAFALTPQTLMENVLEVYEDIEDYAAVVHTYSADSMDVSGSVFEHQPPRVVFNLFFRKPDEHAVEEIGDTRRGVFRIELLSTLMHLTRLEMRIQNKMFLLGHECHVLEVVDPGKPGDKAVLWVSPPGVESTTNSLSSSNPLNWQEHNSHTPLAIRAILSLLKPGAFFPSPIRY